jgi:hypothetical protein
MSEKKKRRPEGQKREYEKPRIMWEDGFKIQVYAYGPSCAKNGMSGVMCASRPAV